MDVVNRMSIWVVSIVVGLIVGIATHSVVGLVVALVGMVVGDQLGNRIFESRQAKKHPEAVGSASRSVSEGLVRLADLHSSGELTDDEYEAAKNTAIRNIR